MDAAQSGLAYLEPVSYARERFFIGRVSIDM